MALTAPSSTLTGQTIAASYDQVLFLDAAAGVTEATLKIVSGTAGKTALSISDEHVLIKGVDTNNAAGFEVQQTDGTSILKVAAGTPSVLVSGSGTKLYLSDAGGEYISGDGTNLTITSGADIILAGTAVNITADTIDLSDATKDVTLNAAVDALNFDSNTLSIDATNNRVGIGTSTPTSKLDVDASGGSGGAAHDGTYGNVMFDSNDHNYVQIGSPSNKYGALFFSDNVANAGHIYYFHTDNSMRFGTNATNALILDSSQNATFAGDVDIDGYGAIGNTTVNTEYELLVGNIGNNAQLKIKASADSARLYLDAEDVSNEYCDMHWQFGGATKTHMQVNQGGNFYLKTGGQTLALTVDSSQNATFAGLVHVDYASDIQAHFEGDGSGDGGIKLTRSSAGKFGTIRYNGSYMAFHTNSDTADADATLKLDNDDSATFAGDVNIASMTNNGDAYSTGNWSSNSVAGGRWHAIGHHYGVWTGYVYFTHDADDRAYDIEIGVNNLWTAGEIIMLGTYSYTNTTGWQKFKFYYSQNTSSNYGSAVTKETNASDITNLNSFFSVAMSGNGSNSGGWDSNTNKHKWSLRKSGTDGNGAWITIILYRDAKTIFENMSIGSEYGY